MMVVGFAVMTGLLSLLAYTDYPLFMNRLCSGKLIVNQKHQK